MIGYVIHDSRCRTGGAWCFCGWSCEVDGCFADGTGAEKIMWKLVSFRVPKVDVPAARA